MLRQLVIRHVDSEDGEALRRVYETLVKQLPTPPVFTTDVDTLWGMTKVPFGKAA
jgi:hypothetical protein